jgi:drug/metabolite transporter (DMT)-like permease
VLSALLAINASLCWGFSDYLGGVSTRAVPVLRVLAISQPAGLAVVTAAVICWGSRLAGGSDALLAIAAGALSVAALGLLYAAMTKGSMIVVAPLAATGAIIPVLIGLLRGEAITPIAAAGIIMALLGAPAAAWQPDRERRSGHNLAAAALALAAGAASGLWFTVMDLASDGNPIGATEVMRLTACLIAVSLYTWRRRGRRTDPAAETARTAPRLSRGTVTGFAIMIIGVTDAIAEISFTSAATVGQLSIISPLSSLYPAVTVFLAAAVLRERVHPVQAAGALCALAGAALLAV